MRCCAPITRFCAEQNLGLRQEKGIIHRDLKPSNVLVARYDGVAVLKVIDFGVAKALGTPLTQQTLCTVSA